MPNAKQAARKATSKKATPKKTAAKPKPQAGAKKATTKKAAAKPKPNAASQLVASKTSKRPSGVTSPSVAATGERVNGRKAAPATANAAQSNGRPSMVSKPTTIDDYLSHVDGPKRTLLQELRETIRQLEPDAEECISYSMPAFRWRGKVIGGFAATREGGSYYPFSGTTLDTLGDALEGYSRTKSGLHFTSEKPLPPALVRQLLETRKAELGR